MAPRSMGSPIEPLTAEGPRQLSAGMRQYYSYWPYEYGLYAWERAAQIAAANPYADSLKIYSDQLADARKALDAQRDLYSSKPTTRSSQKGISGSDMAKLLDIARKAGDNMNTDAQKREELFQKDRELRMDEAESIGAVPSSETRGISGQLGVNLDATQTLGDSIEAIKTAVSTDKKLGGDMAQMSPGQRVALVDNLVATIPAAAGLDEVGRAGLRSNLASELNIDLNATADAGADTGGPSGGGPRGGANRSHQGPGGAVLDEVQKRALAAAGRGGGAGKGITYPNDAKKQQEQDALRDLYLKALADDGLATRDEFNNSEVLYNKATKAYRTAQQNGDYMPQDAPFFNEEYLESYRGVKQLEGKVRTTTQATIKRNQRTPDIIDAEMARQYMRMEAARTGAPVEDYMLEQDLQRLPTELFDKVDADPGTIQWYKPALLRAVKIMTFDADSIKEDRETTGNRTFDKISGGKTYRYLQDENRRKQIGDNNAPKALRRAFSDEASYAKRLWAVDKDANLADLRHDAQKRFPLNQEKAEEVLAQYLALQLQQRKLDNRKTNPRSEPAASTGAPAGGTSAAPKASGPPPRPQPRAEIMPEPVEMVAEAKPSPFRFIEPKDYFLEDVVAGRAKPRYTKTSRG